MAPFTLNETELPPLAVQALRDYLWTEQIALADAASGSLESSTRRHQRGQGTVFAIPCDVELIHDAGGSLLLLCARPLPDDPAHPTTYGDIFPHMPGQESIDFPSKGDPDAASDSAAVAEGSSSGEFLLRFCALQNPIFVYVYSEAWGSHVPDGGSGAKHQSGPAEKVDDVQALLGQLTLWQEWSSGQTVELILEAQNATYLWSNLATLPGLDPLADMLGFGSAADLVDTQLSSVLIGARVSYPGTFPELSVQIPLGTCNLGLCEVTNTRLELASPLYNSFLDTHIQLKGQMALPDNRYIELEIDYPLDGDLVVGIARYVHSSRPDIPDALPAALQVAESGALVIAFSKSSRTLETIRFSIEIDDWALAPGILTLERLTFDFAVQDPLGSRLLTATVAAQAWIGQKRSDASGIRLFCEGYYPSGHFHLGLDPASTLRLRDLFREMLGTSNGVPDLAFYDLDVSYNLHTGHLAAEISVAGSWPILDAVVLDELHFAIRGQESYSGRAAAQLTIHDIDISLSAEYDGSWQFEGRTGPDQNIHIGHLIADLTHKFSTDAAIPASISGLTLSDLHVSFNSESKDFSFSGAASLPLGDGDNPPHVDINVLVEIKHQQDGYFTKHFGGHIVLGDRQFGLSFDKDPVATTFLAAYNNPNGDKVKVAALVAEVSPDIGDDIPASLAFTLNDALFVYHKKTGTKMLFALDIGSGINLSNLPLVGKVFPPDQTIDLAYKVLYANNGFETSDIKTVNPLLPAGLPPLSDESPPSKGLDLAVTLHLGTDVIPLDLPVRIKEPDGSTATADDTAPGGERALVATEASRDSVKWFALQKSFGPVHFERLGLDYREQKVWFLLDVSLAASGLTLALEGLSVGSPLTEFRPEFDLRGVGIDYKSSGGVEIGGRLVRYKGAAGESDRYDGMVVLKTETLSLSALGSYARSGGHPSLFVYLTLDYPLGGPPFFFVKGLAGGFGYNRSLVIPPIEELPQFPLITAAKNPAPAAGSDKTTSIKDQQASLVTQLQALQTYVKPEVGQQWLAVGVHFSSFELVDGFALLSVAFGHRFEISLLGQATYDYPPGSDEIGTPLTRVDIVFKVSYLPDEGILEARALITQLSFLYHPSCVLTGGMAFKTWFEDTGGGKKDDFVFTVGGYHPKFVVPDHYPQVPRLGFSWHYSEALTIKGGAYFAMTGQVLMAGAFLDALWDKGDLRAWFKASADFLIRYKPFHYDATVSVEIGASVTIHFFGTHHLTVRLGASLHIWGPDFAGTATLDIWVASFTIQFGADGKRVEPIGWVEFCDSFLPESGRQLVSVSIQDGLTRTVTVRATDHPQVFQHQTSEMIDVAIVNPKELSILTNSVVPITDDNVPVYVRRTAESNPDSVPVGGEPEFARAVFDRDQIIRDVGIAPMKKDNAVAVQTVTVTRLGGADAPSGGETQKFDHVPVLKSVPAGLWGEWHDSSEQMLNAESALIPDTLAGIEVRAPLPHQPDKTAIIKRQNFSYETSLVEAAFGWEQTPVADDGTTGQITSLACNSNRDELLEIFGLDPAVVTTVSDALGGPGTAHTPDEKAIIAKQIEQRIQASLLAEPVIMSGQTTTPTSTLTR